MRKLKIGRPSAGLVLGALALIVAVAGNSGAFAGTKVIVRKGEIAKGGYDSEDKVDALLGSLADDLNG